MNDFTDEPLYTVLVDGDEVMHLRYHDGLPITLGDIVAVPVPGGTARARVVMLGDTYEHLDIDGEFVDWVERDRVLESSHLVVEWLDHNPFAHSDPQYAPVGNFMFTPADEHITRAG